MPDPTSGSGSVVGSGVGDGSGVNVGGSTVSLGSGGTCVETWSYHPPSNPPDPQAPGGTITFADHYDPCELFGEGDQVHIELVYVLP